MERKKDLQGVRGWLALLVFGMLVLGPLLSISGVYAEFAIVERQSPELVRIADWSSYKFAKYVATLIFCAISIYGGLGLALKRRPDAVSEAKLILWINYPLSIIVNAVLIPSMMLPNDGKDIYFAIPQLLVSLFAVSIWIAYLNRSLRVKNTYGISGNCDWGDLASQNTKSLDQLDLIRLAEESVNSGASQPAGKRAQEKVFADDDRYYEQAYVEIETRQFMRAIWARAIADADGEELKARALYIRRRAGHLAATAKNETVVPEEGGDGQLMPGASEGASLNGEGHPEVRAKSSVEYQLGEYCGHTQKMNSATGIVDGRENSQSLTGAKADRVAAWVLGFIFIIAVLIGLSGLFSKV